MHGRQPCPSGGVCVYVSDTPAYDSPVMWKGTLASSGKPLKKLRKK